MSTLPRIAELARSGAELSDVQAIAGKLWLANGGAALDEDGAIAATIAAYWKAQPGADPYWDALDTRTSCDACGETYKLENLSICPNCFSLACHNHDRACACGHMRVG